MKLNKLPNIFQSHVRFPFNCISPQQCFGKAFLEACSFSCLDWIHAKDKSSLSYSSIGFAKHCAKFSVNTQAIIIQMYMWSKCKSYLKKGGFHRKNGDNACASTHKGLSLDLAIKTTICMFAQGLITQCDGIYPKIQAAIVTEVFSFPVVTQCPFEVTNIHVGKGDARLHVCGKFLALEALNHLYLMPAISFFSTCKWLFPTA